MDIPDPHSLMTAGHVLISGGLGALGSLVAAWLAASTSSFDGPAITLLGRSGRIPDTSIARTLAGTHSNVRRQFEAPLP